MRPDILSAVVSRQLSMICAGCRAVVDSEDRVEGRGNGQFGIFLCVEHGGDGDTEVGDWTPEI